MKLEITGLAALQLFFRQARRAAQDFGEAWVGSAVEYGPYNEFGTEHMAERPHWRVAIPQVVAEIGGSQRVQNEILDAMLVETDFGARIDQAVSFETNTTAPMVVALKIEREVKRLITSKGIIDTGNYRGSVATGRDEDEAFDRSAERADPDTVVWG